MRKKHPRLASFAGLKKRFRAFFAVAPQGFRAPLSNKGSALIIAIIFMVVAVMLITVGAKLVSRSSRESKQNQAIIAQAENVARAGLVDTLGWFRRKNAVVRDYNNNYSPDQPATFLATSSGVSYVDQIFAPAANSNPALADTMDATIGLVNEFSLDASGNTMTSTLMGRYEVRRQDSIVATPAPTRNPDAVHDITGQRLSKLVNGDGLIWLVTGTGYVYKKLDSTKAYNVPPNKVVAMAKVATEFRKMDLNLPKDSSSNTVWGATYVQATTMVNITSDQAMLNGAVSTSGTYACVGMNAPLTLNNSPTPTPTNTPVPCPYSIDAQEGTESGTILEGISAGYQYIYTNTNNSGSKDFVTWVPSCGTYKVQARMYAGSTSSDRWNMEIVNYTDTNGYGIDSHRIMTTGLPWIDEDVYGDNDGSRGVRNWKLFAGPVTVRWWGQEANTRLSCFSIVNVGATCPNTPTNTPTPTNTATFTPTNTAVAAAGTPVEAETGTETAPIIQTGAGPVYIYTNTDDAGTKEFTVSVTSCGRYRISANVRAPDTNSNSWYLQIVGRPDTSGDIDDIFGYANADGTYHTQDVTVANGSATAREWDLPIGTYIIQWRGREADARLDWFTLTKQSSITCPATYTPTRTPTSLPPGATATSTAVFLTPTPTYTSTPTTPTATWTPNLSCPEVTGATSINKQGPTYCLNSSLTQLDAETVFGMTLSDLKLVADYRGDTTGTNDLDIQSDWKLSYFEGNLTYGSTQPAPYQRLHSSGILVVNGDLILNGGNGSDILPSSFAGVIFVTGDMTVRDGSEVSGAVIMGRPPAHSNSGDLTLSGSGGNRGTIYLNPATVQTAIRLVAQYRENSSARKTLLAIPNL